MQSRSEADQSKSEAETQQVHDWSTEQATSVEESLEAQHLKSTSVIVNEENSGDIDMADAGITPAKVGEHSKKETSTIVTESSVELLQRQAEVEPRQRQLQARVGRLAARLPALAHPSLPRLTSLEASSEPAQTSR